MDHVARNPVSKLEVEYDYSTPQSSGRRCCAGAASTNYSSMSDATDMTSLSVTHVKRPFPIRFHVPQTTTYFQPHVQRTNFLLATSDPGSRNFLFPRYSALYLACTPQNIVYM